MDRQGVKESELTTAQAGVKLLNNRVYSNLDQIKCVVVTALIAGVTGIMFKLREANSQ